MTKPYINSQGSPVISYPVKKAEIILSPSEFTLLQALSKIGGQANIEAIKFVRATFNQGLWEAKQIVDTCGNHDAL